MTTHGTGITTLRHHISRIKRQTDGAIRHHHRKALIGRKKVVFTEEDRARIDAFNAKHGITREPRKLGHLVRSSKKKVTLPTIKL